MALKRWDVLADLAQRFGLTKFAEVGVKAGKNTCAILKLVPGSTVIAVDPWANWSLEQPMEAELQFDKRMQYFQGRITKLKMTGVEAAKSIEDGSLDCVFIDDDHKYETTLANIVAWIPKVREGGVMAGHDIGSKFPGVDRAVREYFEHFNPEQDHVWWVKC